METRQGVRSATLRYWMARRGLNQQQLAAVVGVSQPAVHKWLRSERASMDFGTGMAVAGALRVDPGALFAPPPAE